MIKTVLFDLDGTIVDTNELIIASYMHALEGLTVEPLTREVIIRNMGRPLVEQIRQFTGLDDVAELVTKYRTFNVGKHDEMVCEFPHAREVIAELHRSGVRMGVVTSKVKRTTTMGLELCGLQPYIETVVTVENVSLPKPDPEGILKAMGVLGADKQTTLMVGDSHYDIEAAQNAGIRSAAVAWSLKGEDYLRKFKPDYIIRDMRELLDVVASSAGSANSKG